MVFKRRDKRPFLTRVRSAFYPKGGWRRAFEYLRHRVRRLPDTPHRIALGFACGVFVSFTPLFGIHVVAAMAFAWILRCNIIAALIGTLVGNPLTFPVIAAFALALGRRILGFGVTGRDPSRIQDAFGQFFEGLWESVLSLFGFGTAHWGRLLPFVQDVFWPYLVGGLLPGLVAAVASYYLIRPLITAHQGRRRARMLAVAGARLAQAEPPPYNPGKTEQGRTDE